MLLSYGTFLFLRLIIPPAGAGGIVKTVFLRGLSFLRLIISGLSARDSIDVFSFLGASFLPLIIPPPGGGGVNKDRLPMGPFFFVFNYLWPVSANEINIPR